MTKKSLSYFFLLALFFSCKKDIIKSNFTPIKKVKIYSFEELKPLLNKTDNKTYIINFWATWCGPCIKELPYFEKIQHEFKGKNVEVLLVSLDFPKQIEKKLIPFLNQKKINSKVVVLNEKNNDWVHSIDKNWSGALPATILYNSKNRKFYKESFDYQTLKKELLSFTSTQP